MTTPVTDYAPPALKPGYQTTEFWVALVAQVLALLSLLGVFNVSSSVGDAIIKLAALIAAALGTTGYAVGRGRTKQGHQLAVGQVNTALIAQGALPLAGVRKAKRGDSGLTEFGILGLILLIGGIIVAIISGGHLLLLVIGVVAAVAGFLLLFQGRGGRVL